MPPSCPRTATASVAARAVPGCARSRACRSRWPTRSRRARSRRRPCPTAGRPAEPPETAPRRRDRRTRRAVRPPLPRRAGGALPAGCRRGGADAGSRPGVATGAGSARPDPVSTACPGAAVPRAPIAVTRPPSPRSRGRRPPRGGRAAGPVGRDRRGRDRTNRTRPYPLLARGRTPRWSRRRPWRPGGPGTAIRARAPQRTPGVGRARRPRRPLAAPPRAARGVPATRRAARHR